MRSIHQAGTTFKKPWLRFIGLPLLLVLVVTFPAMGDEENFMLRDDGRVRGSSTAPVTLLEYSDFTCGFCVKFFQETWPQIFTEYVETGKVKLVYRDFPRSLTGPSLDLALAARCSGEQGHYWAMHDRLFQSHAQPSLEELSAEAKTFGLDTNQFSECLLSRRFIEPIFRDRQEGGSLGIRGTPAFVLFLTDQLEDGPVLVIPGAFPFDVFQEQIDRLLAKQAQTSPTPSSNDDAPLPQAMKFGSSK